VQDIIIGVDVQEFRDRNSLKDATRILANYKSSFDRKMKEKYLKTDIYIKPDIKDYGVISFDKGKKNYYERRRSYGI
jgi:NTE family protein